MSNTNLNTRTQEFGHFEEKQPSRIPLAGPLEPIPYHSITLFEISSLNLSIQPRPHPTLSKPVATYF